jgi:signal transduction histidine kinase
MTGVQHRSLFRRLLLGFVGVMMVIWLCTLAWDVYETKTTSKIEVEQTTKGLTRQILLFMTMIADRPDDMVNVVRKIEDIRDGLYKERDLYPDRMQIQVWKGKDIVYASAPELRSSLPPGGPAGRPVEDSWVSWMETDAASGITVRVAQEVTGQWLFTISSIGYYLLPLLYSFPFLLVPAWFIVKVGLRPLNSIVKDIEERSASDLSPLADSPYRELSPLVHSVNRLMERLTERLEREQEFLADAAHELKTPLAVIQINADSLVSSQDPQRIRAAANGLQNGVERATHTVHQLLALARSSTDREHAELQELDLVELVRDRLALAVHVAWQRGIEIELQSPEQCMLPSHRESMALLIDNLISNAVKYSPDRTRVTVCVTSDDAGSTLTVSDEGPGIPQDMRRKVFERFFRLPGQDQAGSGLGLAIAERAVMHNRGAIRIEDGPAGAGLTVAVDFPKRAGEITD